MAFQVIPALRRNRCLRCLVIASLLAVFFLLALDSMRRESVTIDEPLHLTAGYTFWKFHDYRLQESHGALPQRWFALPLLGSKVTFPPRNEDGWWQPGFLGARICKKFLYDSGNDPDAMVFHGRLMAIIIVLCLAFAVYHWTARIFGTVAGLIACFLCILDPTILAQGPLMTSDVTAALFFLLSVASFWQLLRGFTWFRLAISTACFGLLMVSKMSGPLVVPMLPLIFLTRLALGRPWPMRFSGHKFRRIGTLSGKIFAGSWVALVHIVGAFVIIWSFYGWQYQPGPGWQPDRDSYTESRESVFNALGALRPFFVEAENSKILPEAYLYGLAHTYKNSEKRPAFLNGHYSNTGWWYYFPYCFLVKTPLTLLGLLGFGVAGLAYRACRPDGVRRRTRFWAWLDRTSFLWSLLLVYGVAAIFTNLNIGHRHLLPIYPPLFMLAGAVGQWFLRGRRWAAAAVTMLLFLQILVIARIHPYYLSYFNELVGPSKGYLHLTDSSVDWGQDLPPLVRWLQDHPELKDEGALYLNYFGFDRPPRWGIQANRLPGITNPHFSITDPLTCRSGTYCFSATELMVPRLGRPWDDMHEREYRDMFPLLEAMSEKTPPSADDTAGVEAWNSFLNHFADYQFRRLRNYLINRKPDAMIGYSILIFRLSDTELRTALLPPTTP